MTFHHRHRPTRRAWQAAVVVIAVLVLAGCSSHEQAHAPSPPPVGVMVIQAQQVPLVRDATGRFSAYRSADVRARVAGVLLQRTYKEGTHVDKNQVLFKIDPAPFKATLEAAKASLAQAQATYTNAKVSAKRAHKLAPKGYISQADLDNAEAAERTAAAAVQAAKAKADSARINLGYATVRSPIAGRAGKQQETEGALVGQNTDTLLTTVRQINPLYLNFSLPVTELQQIRSAQTTGDASLVSTHKTKVRITLPDGSVYPKPGTLDFSGIAVDPSTGSVTLRALVPNPEYLLLPGMYAQLEINLGTLNHAYLVPQQAVQRDTSGAYVLTVGKDNKVVRTDVNPGRMEGPNWIITGGIHPGDKVIVSGIAKARIGSAVTPSVEKPLAQGPHDDVTRDAPATPATAKPAAATSTGA